MANVLRNIPSVNELLDSPPLRKLMDRASRSVVLSGVRDFLDNLRQRSAVRRGGDQTARRQRNWPSGSPSGSCTRSGPRCVR